MAPEEEPKPVEESKPVLPPADRPARSSRHRRRSRHGARKRPEQFPAQPEQVSALSGEVFAPPSTEPEGRAPISPASTPGSPLGKAIEQVTGIIEELKHVLGEMEEVLETLELAERQKIDDEREIESLQQALRQLRRPGDGGQRRH